MPLYISPTLSEEKLKEFFDILERLKCNTMTTTATVSKYISTHEEFQSDIAALKLVPELGLSKITQVITFESLNQARQWMEKELKKRLDDEKYRARSIYDNPVMHSAPKERRVPPAFIFETFTVQLDYSQKIELDCMSSFKTTLKTMDGMEEFIKFSNTIYDSFVKISPNNFHN